MFKQLRKDVVQCFNFMQIDELCHFFAWRDSFAQKDAAVGAWLQWVHVTAQSEIAGDCTATVFTDPAATQSYAESTDYAVDFKKGWNLMRNDITEVHGDPTGRKYAQRIRIDAMQETPADVSWFFVAY